MYTDCPNCHTYFKITPMQLKAADGKVRCGSCSHVFNALTNLVEKVPPASSRSPTSRISEPVENTTSKLNPSSRTSLSANSELIDLSDTLPSANESNVASLHDSSVVALSQSPNALDDINKDIDDALDDLFDDDSLVVAKPSLAAPQTKSRQPKSKPTQSNELPEFKLDENKRKKETAPVSEVSELDLDGFDDLLFEANDSNDPPLEAMSENDSFTSSEPLARHEVEWETLSRPAKPPSPPKPSKIEAMKSRIGEGVNVSRTMWIIIICLLIIVLLGQFAYSKHEQLVRSAPLKVVLEQACAVIDIFVDCTIPNPRDLDAFVIIDRNVVGHPNAENALLITSTIRNEAEFNQQFPELILTFLDINQQILARRTFKPEEYLPKDSDILPGIDSKQPVKVMLEIVDPGEAAVNFEFDFR